MREGGSGPSSWAFSLLLPYRKAQEKESKGRISDSKLAAGSRLEGSLDEPSCPGGSRGWEWAAWGGWH